MILSKIHRYQDTKIKVNKIFIVAYFILLIVALLNGGILFYYFLYSMTFLLIISVSYIFILLASISFEIKRNAKIYSSGEAEKCKMIIKSKLDIPIPYIKVKTNNVEQGEKKYEGQLINLTSEDSLYFSSELQYNHRGIYKPEVIEVSFYDLFNIIKMKKIYRDKNLIKVYPKIYDVEDYIYYGKGSITEGAYKKSLEDDIFSLIDVRLYNEGDNLKKVHWKLSARTDKLYVKNNDKLSVKAASMLIDLNINNNINGALVEEGIIDEYLSIVYFFMKLGIEIKLNLNCESKKNMTVRTGEDFINLMEFFVAQESDSKIHFSKYVENFIMQESGNREIFLLVSCIDLELCEILERYSNMDYKFTIYLCGDVQVNNIEFLNLSNAGVNTISIVTVNSKNIKWWELIN